MNNATTDGFVETREYQRFVEFCDACRQHRYIGLCYGRPGVGKTLSARRYARWDRVAGTQLFDSDESDAYPRARFEVRSLRDGDTVYYVPEVMNSPRSIVNNITTARSSLQECQRQKVHDELDEELEKARQALIAAENEFRQDRRCHYYVERPKAVDEAQRRFWDVRARLTNRLLNVSDPTTMIIVDEADRLKVAGLEQVRDIFDQHCLGVVLIGMPGMEKRLARYPQLYSRVGFVHEFRPLTANDVRHLLTEWHPAGVRLPAGGFSNDEGVASVIRVVDGNFRLLNRLLTQIARVLEINCLDQVTAAVVDAARESLVIGAT